MRTIAAKPYASHGKTRWRVIVPSDLSTTGKRATKVFKTQVDASAYAADLNRKRLSSVGELMAAPANVQEACARAMRLLGPLAVRMYEAAELFLRELEKRPRSPQTVADCVRECIESKQAAGRRHTYLSQLRVSLGKFAARFGEREIGQVNPGEIEDWLNGNGWGQSTRRGYLTDVRTLFGFAISRGHCVENFASRVERPSHDDKPPAIFTPDQMKSVLGWALEHDLGLIPYLALGAFAGIRPHEARRLAKADIAGGYVHVAGRVAKTRQRRLVTITGALEAWLNVRGGEYQPKNLSRRLKRLIAGTVKTWPHDVLRHSFASYHLALHGSAEQTALQLGHSNTTMLFAHYRELVTKEQAEAWFALKPPAPKEKKSCRRPRRRGRG